VKCPVCKILLSNKKDICTQCRADLRPHKKLLNIQISNPRATFEQLVADLEKELLESAKAAAKPIVKKSGAEKKKAGEQKKTGEKKTTGAKAQPASAKSKAAKASAAKAKKVKQSPAAQPQKESKTFAFNFSGTAKRIFAGWSKRAAAFTATISSLKVNKNATAEEPSLETTSARPLATEAPATEIPATIIATTSPAETSSTAIEQNLPGGPSEEELLDAYVSSVDNALTEALDATAKLTTEAETADEVAEESAEEEIVPQKPKEQPISTAKLKNITPHVAPEVMDFSEDVDSFTRQLDALYGDLDLDVEAVNEPKPNPEENKVSSFLLDDDLEISIEIEGETEDSATVEQEIRDEEAETEADDEQEIQALEADALNTETIESEIDSELLESEFQEGLIADSQEFEAELAEEFAEEVTTAAVASDGLLSYSEHSAEPVIDFNALNLAATASEEFTAEDYTAEEFTSGEYTAEDAALEAEFSKFLLDTLEENADSEIGNYEETWGSLELQETALEELPEEIELDEEKEQQLQQELATQDFSPEQEVPSDLQQDVESSAFEEIERALRNTLEVMRNQFFGSETTNELTSESNLEPSTTPESALEQIEPVKFTDSESTDEIVEPLTTEAVTADVVAVEEVTFKEVIFEEVTFEEVTTTDVQLTAEVIADVHSIASVSIAQIAETEIELPASEENAQIAEILKEEPLIPNFILVGTAYAPVEVLNLRATKKHVQPVLLGYSHVNYPLAEFIKPKRVPRPRRSTLTNIDVISLGYQTVEIAAEPELEAEIAALVEQVPIFTQAVSDELWGTVFGDLQQIEFSEEAEVEFELNELFSLKREEKLDLLFELIDEELFDPSAKRSLNSQINKSDSRQVDTDEISRAFTSFKKDVIKTARDVRTSGKKVAMYGTRSKKESRAEKSLYSREHDILPAPASKRMIAATFDLAVTTAITLVIAFAIKLVPSEVAWKLLATRSLNLLEILPYLFQLLNIFCWVWIFSAMFFSAGPGRTLGQKLMRLQVVDSQGNGISLRQGAIWSLSQVATLLTCGLGLLGIVFKSRRAMHDALAEVYVEQRVEGA